MKKSHFLFLLSFFFLFPKCYIGSNTDSLKIAIQQAKQDTNKVILLNKLGKQLWLQGEYDSAMVFIQTAKTLSQTLNYKKGLGDAYNSIGAIYRLTGDFKNALSFFKTAQKIREEIKDYKGAASTIKNIGGIYESEGNYPEALKNYFAALKLFESIGDQKGIANSHIGICNIHDYQSKYKEALSHGFIALKIQESLNDQTGIANSHIGIGVIYYNQGIYTVALQHFQSALNISEKIDYKQGVSFSHNNIGNIYKNTGNYTEALKNYDISLKIKEEMEDLDGVASSYINLGSIYISLNDLKQAKNNLLKAAELSIKVGNKDNIKLIYGYNARIDSIQGNFKNAYYNFYNYITCKDSLLNEENTQKSIQTQLQYEFDKKETQAKTEQLKKDLIAAEEAQQQKIILWFVIISLTLTVCFAMFMINRYRITNKQKKIIEIKEQETQKQNEIITNQKHLVEEKQKEILESITYAKRLQEAILPSKEFINSVLKENFVYYKPKDLVAGDFYWCEQKGDLIFIAAADSTGHGVPGAMVSVVCYNALNRSLNEYNITDTGKLLDKTRELVLETFGKSNNDVKDGMDISLLCINKVNNQIFWSGANNPLWYIENGEMKGIKPNKQPIGKTENPKQFTTHQIDFVSNTTFYLFTDGYADQFGGEKGKKFKYKELALLVQANHHLSLSEQNQILNKTFENWKGDLEQVDDVCVIGIKI